MALDRGGTLLYNEGSFYMGGRAMYTFNHFNFNVFDLERSLKFYDEALGLKPVREKNAADGRYKIVFLGDGRTGFQLELTWLRDRAEPYDLGEQEYHLAFVADDFDQAHARHAELGLICFENPDMGIYFLEDPDGYWIEIIPPRK
jgi:lactoylglutathione lyase